MATIPELTKQINQLTISIENAKGRLEEFQRILSDPAMVKSSAYADAATGIERVSKSIKEMTALQKQLTTQRMKLVDEKNIVDVEKISEKIAKIKEQIASLNQQKSTRMLNTDADVQGLQDLDNQIHKLETSLTNLERRRTTAFNKATGYIPGGAGGGENLPTNQQSPLENPNVNLSRLALQDVKAGITREQMGSNATNKVWNQYLREIELARLRIKFEGDTHYQAARKWAEANGFAIEDLKKIQAYAGGKQQVATFEKLDEATGVMKQGRVGINEGGQVTQSYIPRQNQTFGQGIFRDFAELTKWSIAITLLYAPLNALNDALTKMVENQAKLAQVAIAVNSSVATQSQIFNTAATIADRMGESVGGVIDAFDQAYRAAGSAAEGASRYIVATKLLEDSITLSKISTLDQASAIDYLSAALLQTNRPLTEGAHLLDEWVLVSRNANVTVGDLAQAVASIGGSAETAGLSIEQLNAVVAALSQSTPLTGASLTNAVKALIGQYQTPEATKALQNYGIAVKDISGKTREFLDVMNDVARLRKGGILGKEDFNTLTLALGGGGIRNQKNVQQFIENLSKGTVDTLTKLQEGAGGQAAQALSTKLDTVQTATTRLSNAFQELGQSLGTKGGLLDALTILLKLATALVDTMTALSNALGKTGPLLAGVGIAALLSKNSGAMGGMIGTMFPFLGGKGAAGEAGVQAAAGVPASNMLFGPAMLNAQRSAMLKSAGLSAAAIAIPAISNIGQKDYTAAGADIAGGIAGALVAGPVGAVVGAAIAEAFVNSTINYKSQFANFFADTAKAAKAEEAPAPANTEVLTQQAYRALGGNAQGNILNEWLGILRAEINKEASRGNNPQGRFTTVESSALSLLEKVNPQLYAAIKAYKPIEQQAIKYQTPEVMGQLGQLQATKTEQLRQQVSQGEISPTDYANQLQALGGYAVTATQYMAAFGAEFKKLRPEIKNDTEEYQKFLDIITYGSEEQKTTINSLIAGLQGLSGKQLEAQKDALARYVNQVYQQTTVSQIQLPQIVGPTTPGTGRTQGEVNLIQKTAQQMQELFYKSQGLNTDQVNALEDSFKSFAVYVEDSGKQWYQAVEKTDQKFYSDAEKTLEKLGKISTPQEGFGIQQFDTTRPILESMAAKSVALGQQWAKQYPGFETNPEQVLASTTDGITKPITADLKILAILLQSLNDKAQKQLDGMYNIPEGATFWVPITAAFYRPQGGAGAGGVDVSKLNEALNPNTWETKMNTAALEALTLLLKEGKPVEPTPNMPPALYKKAFNAHEQQYWTGYIQPDLPPAELQSKYYMEQRAKLTISPEELQARSYAERRAAAEQAAPQTSPFQDFLDRILGKGKYTTPQAYEAAPEAPKMLSDQNKKNLENMGGDVLTFLDKFGSGILDKLGIPETVQKQDTGNIGQNIINDLNKLLNSFMSKGNLQNEDKYGNLGTPQAGKIASIAQTVTMPEVSTKLNLNINSTTQLMVDGRVLAQIIKPYLASDLLQAQQSQSAVTQTYVIS